MKIIIIKKIIHFLKEIEVLFMIIMKLDIFNLKENVLIVKILKKKKKKIEIIFGCICEQCENGYSKSDDRICKLCNYDKIIKNDWTKKFKLIINYLF